MAFSIGIVGIGQFGHQFATLFNAHPGVERVFVTDVLPERTRDFDESHGFAGAFASFEDMLASPEVDAIGLFTQRWTHGPLVVQALRAGKHVFSAVPMAITEQEIRDIISAVEETGLVYMMNETSYYNPATVFARQQIEQGTFGRIIYAEGDYLHDMDLGFYEAYKYSGGENWKATASYPPMLYPTHAIGGVLGAWDTYATAVACNGIVDQRGDGVFDRSVSQFNNDFSNATALFEMAGGGSMRTNEFRRVGYPAHIRESRFSFFGTDASFDQTALCAFLQDKEQVTDVSAQVATTSTMSHDDPALAHVDPALRDAFISGYAAVHDVERLPEELRGQPNGHEGSHHFLVDDFVQAVNGGTMPTVNAWMAARFTLPGIYAHESARQGGVRLEIPYLGDAPAQPGERWGR